MLFQGSLESCEGVRLASKFLTKEAAPPEDAADAWAPAAPEDAADAWAQAAPPEDAADAWAQAAPPEDAADAWAQSALFDDVLLVARALSKHHCCKRS